MEQMFCKYLPCSKPLKYTDEILTGICTEHMNEIRDDKNYVAVCWQCGKITIIQSRRIKKDFKIKDKYIFARGCKNCTGIEHEGIMWMTIKSNSQPTSAVTPTGKITRYSGHSKVVAVT